MIKTVPGLLLFVMIVLTLVLLPYLNAERPRSNERTGRTDELHIKPQPKRMKRDTGSVKREA